MLECQISWHCQIESPRLASCLDLGRGMLLLVVLCKYKPVTRCGSRRRRYEVWKLYKVSADKGTDSLHTGRRGRVLLSEYFFGFYILFFLPLLICVRYNSMTHHRILYHGMQGPQIACQEESLLRSPQGKTSHPGSFSSALSRNIGLCSLSVHACCFSWLVIRPLNSNCWKLFI